MSVCRSALVAAVRALIAPLRATRSARMDSTTPSWVFGVPVAVPGLNRTCCSESIG